MLWATRAVGDWTWWGESGVDGMVLGLGLVGFVVGVVISGPGGPTGAGGEPPLAAAGSSFNHAIAVAVGSMSSVSELELSPNVNKDERTLVKRDPKDVRELSLSFSLSLSPWSQSES